MPKTDPLLAEMRRICLALPDTRETMTWGKPHFRVGEKIFCGCGEERDRPVIGFKLEMGHARLIVKDPRFWPAAYVGHKGWVSMDLSAVRNWDEVRALVLESYRLIAPQRSLKKLLGAQPAPAATPRRVRREASARARATGARDAQRPAARAEPSRAKKRAPHRRGAR